MVAIQWDSVLKTLLKQQYKKMLIGMYNVHFPI